jgi:hypothetical protein
MFSSRIWSRSACLVAITLGTALVPVVANAQVGDQAAMEARIQRLEAAVSALTQQLEAERIRAAQPTQVETRVQALETRAAAPVPEGFRVGSTNFRLSGFLKADGVFSDFTDGAMPATVAGGTTSREFYVPGATPVGGVGEGMFFNGHAKQTRLVMTATPTIEGHTATALVEMDFNSAAGSQGTQNVSNAYNLGLRRAYFTYDNWLFGQDWTTFLNIATLADTADFIGTTDGTVFARQPLVRYTRRLSDSVTLVAALENPETITAGVGTAPNGAQDDDLLPDAVARINLTQPFGQFSVAAIARQLSVDNPTFGETALGWGVSVAGKIPFGASNRHDLRISLTTGEGIGRYIGLGTAADAYALTVGGARLDPIGVTAGTAALRFVVSPQVRLNLGGGFQTFDLDPTYSTGSATETTWSAFGNLFYSPVAGTDLGVELRHGERETLNGLSGGINRVHLVAKRTF